MSSTAVLTALLTLAPLPASPPVCGPDARLAPAVVPAIGAEDERLRELWGMGETFDDFLEGVDRRRELWEENWATSAGIAGEMVDRAVAAGGTWHVLVVAVDGCSDSVSTVPYFARLVERAPNLDMRIIDSDTGAEIMTAYPTPDGRRATPTFLLLDADFEPVGCFVERPMWLRDHIIENPDGLDRSGIFEMKMKWYADNEGRDTVREFVQIIEGAAAGRPVCAPTEGR